MATAPRIAFVDLTFNWPPVGGCWIDTYHVIKSLQERGAEVHLFVPDFKDYYPRGNIKETLPFPYTTLPFNRLSFHFKRVIKTFRAAVNAFNPDIIFISDGYHMKNHLLTAFGPERCLLRFYSYELMCINLHYYRYREERICDQGYFHNPIECHRCWFHRMPAIGRAAQILLGAKEEHPKLHFSQEYLGSLAFTESYRNKLLENLSTLGGAIVYNDFMREQLAPYTNNIHVIPSGVDSELFTPGQRSTSETVKIFLPGRANDPLKGLPVLIHAAEILQRQNLPFEIHYTAAMDLTEDKPWLINRGWVPQEALPELYQEMDIVVVPSTWIEPFGITALEGMASGLPVVASNHGGLAQSIVHQETGLLVEPGNPSELAGALRTLIQDKELRVQLGNAGRERVQMNYNWPVVIDHYYEPLLRQHGISLGDEELISIAEENSEVETE